MAQWPDHNQHSDGDSLDNAEIIEHLKSIESIPMSLLPDDAVARSALILLAAAGYDCYAYASGGELTGTWCAWLSELARVREDRNGRVPVMEWAEQWRDLLADAYKGRARQQGGGDAR